VVVAILRYEKLSYRAEGFEGAGLMPEAREKPDHSTKHSIQQNSTTERPIRVKEKAIDSARLEL